MLFSFKSFENYTAAHDLAILKITSNLVYHLFFRVVNKIMYIYVLLEGILGLMFRRLSS